MASHLQWVTEFLRGTRFGVAGVSRDRSQAANAIYRKLRACGYEVYPINPHASETEGAACYPDVGSVPVVLDGVVIATHPKVSLVVVRQCAERAVSPERFRYLS